MWRKSLKLAGWYRFEYTITRKEGSECGQQICSLQPQQVFRFTTTIYTRETRILFAASIMLQITARVGQSTTTLIGPYSNIIQKNRMKKALYLHFLSHNPPSMRSCIYRHSFIQQLSRQMSDGFISTIDAFTQPWIQCHQMLLSHSSFSIPCI